MRKATVKRMLVREIYSNLSQLVNGRQEISRGNGDFGVGRYFEEVEDKKEFLEMLEKNGNLYCIETLSGKYIEVDKTDIGRFTNL